MLIDLSHTLNNITPAYPGDSPIAIENQANLEQNGYVSFAIHSGMHTGTHIDAPVHMIASKPTIDTYALEQFGGNAIIIDCCNQNKIDLTNEVQSILDSCEYDIVLFYTGYDEFFHQPEVYFYHHPEITMDLAEYLVSKKVKLIGFDMPSPDRLPFTVHKFLLQNDVFIVENLTNLQFLLQFKSFEFFAIPLKIEAEGSFVRAFAKI